MNDIVSDPDQSSVPSKPRVPKPAIVAVAVAVIAGLGLGGAYLAGAFDQSQPEQQPEVVTVDEPESEDVTATIELDAPNWEEGSSPFVVHFDGCCAATEDVDFYHAVSAGDEASAEVTLPAGRYEVSYISAINPDGSIYRTPGEPATIVIGEAEADTETETPDADATNDATNDADDAATTDANASTDASDDASTDETTLDVGGSFEQVPAEDVTQDDIDGILGDLADAVEKGDETLTGDAGQQVVDTATGNAQNAPNVDKDETEQAGSDASDAVKDEPTQPSGSTGSGSSNSNSNSNSGNSSSSSSSSNSGSSASKPTGGSSSSNSGSSSSSSQTSQTSQPTHTHNWVAQTTVVHHDATGHYESVPVYGTVTTTVYHAECQGCGASAGPSTSYDGAIASFIKQHTMSCGMGKAHSWTTQSSEQVQTGTEQKWVQDSAAWDETVVTGYKCSGCGATK